MLSALLSTKDMLSELDSRILCMRHPIKEKASLRGSNL